MRELTGWICFATLAAMVVVYVWFWWLGRRQVGAEPIVTETEDSMGFTERGIHDWFGLTYGNYLVVPRTLLEQMPMDWQNEMVSLLDKADAFFSDVPDYEYKVTAIDPKTKRYTKDPLAEYRHPMSLTPREQEGLRDGTAG